MILAGIAAAAGLGATLTAAAASAPDAASRSLRVEFRTDKSAPWKVYGTAHVDLTTDSSFYREAAERSPDARIVLSFTPAYAAPVSSCLEAAAAEGDKNGGAGVDGVWRRCLATAVSPAAQPTPSDAAAAEAPTLAEFRISEETAADRPTGDAAPPPALPHPLHTTVKVGSGLTREKLMVGPNGGGGGPRAAGTFLQEVFTIDLGLRGVPIALSYQLRAVAKPTSGEISATAVKLGFPQLAPRPLLANEETVEEMTNPANQKPQAPVAAPPEKSFFTKYWWAILLAIMAANFLTQEAPQAAQPEEAARSPPTACQNQQPPQGAGGPRQRAPGAPRSR